MLEYLFIGILIAAILLGGIRSLWRTWHGHGSGTGCAGCAHCQESAKKPAATPSANPAGCHCHAPGDAHDRLP